MFIIPLFIQQNNCLILLHPSPRCRLPLQKLVERKIAEEKKKSQRRFRAAVDVNEQRQESIEHTTNETETDSIYENKLTFVENFIFLLLSLLLQKR